MSEVNEIEILKARLEMQSARIKDVEAENYKYLNLLNKVRQENNAMKQILDYILKTNDICKVYESKGQYLPECKCTENNQCIENMINLWSVK